MDDALSYDTIKSIKQTNNNKNENKCLDELIATLKDEIKFLRNELSSKVQTLSNDLLNERAGKNVNDFVVKSSGSNTESKDVCKNKFVNAEKTGDVNTTVKSCGKINGENKHEKKL